MSRNRASTVLRSQRKPLAAAVAALFALNAPSAIADTWIVNTCDEGNSGNLGTKTGTLRFAAANAAMTGDTIDMTAIGCSLISLKTGAIHFGQDDLKILGPGMNALEIEAKYSTGAFSYKFDYDRVFTHTGTGNLQIYDLTVSKGYLISASGTANGGCLYSAGTLNLYNVQVSYCQANTTSGFAKGGGIYAAKGLSMLYGILGGPGIFGAGNSANAGGAGFAEGGGAFVKGGLFLKYSTVSNNSANSAPHYAFGGGMTLYQTTLAIVRGSTISGNSSQWNEGGLDFFDHSGYAGNTLIIANSTISGNTATGIIGGVYADSGAIEVDSSTIAFNTSASGTTYGYGPGLAIMSRSGVSNITMQSSLLAQNVYAGSTENDLTLGSANVAIGGADNLIRATSVPDAYLPTTTHKAGCPLLGPLRDNGGLTQTHTLHSHSIAIDAGNTNAQRPLIGGPYPSDQRGTIAQNGTFTYVRKSGPLGDPTPTADIGALEVQQDETLFDSGFDGCAPL